MNAQKSFFFALPLGTKFMRRVEKHMKNSPIEEIETTIWSIFDILRGRVDMNESYILLLYLSLYKDDLLSKVFTLIDEDSSTELAQRYAEEYADKLPDDKKELSRNYDIIIQRLFHSLVKIGEPEIFEIVEKLEEIDRELLSENFQVIFDSVLYKIVQSQGRYAGEYVLPVEISKFMVSLANLHNKSKVYNPFAGLASFGVFLDRKYEYFGQEINSVTWALGLLRIMAYGRYHTSIYNQDDSILNWPSSKNKYDLIIANPPYGLKLNRANKNEYGQLRTVEQFLIEKGTNSLKADGKLVALLPQGFLFRGGNDQNIRKFLVEEDLIDTIISLPAGLLLNTGISLTIVVIRKRKDFVGKVRFIDSKTFVESKGSKDKILNESALNLLLQNNIESEVQRFISLDQIRECDYNLNVSRYFQKEIKGIKLSEVLEYITGNKSNKIHSNCKFVRIRDLKDDKLDFNLDLKSVEKAEMIRQDTQIIDKSCLLLAMRWKALKPTYFKFEGVPICRNQDILSFKVNESLVNVAYLINELHSEYVKEQLDAYRIGGVIPFIRREDLLNIKITLPSLDEQQAKVQGIAELSVNIKSLQQERNALAHGRASLQFNEFASLKHTLGRPRQNILDWTDNLLDFLSSNDEGFKSLNKAFADFYEQDILSALTEIKKDINFITEVLEKGEKGLVLDEYDLKLIPLSEINTVIKELSDNGYNFRLEKRIIKGERLKDRGIECNTTLFKTLLDNILTNASKHGFLKKEEGNELVIEFTEVEDILIIDIKNNGIPFPSKYDKEKFITKYSTASPELGSGLGGYDINRIAIYFNNPDWDLILNEDPLYPIKFKFKFPIKLIK
jgi:type I restriction enzyme M protein